MKELILTLLFILSLKPMYSQDCEVKKDPITNDTIISFTKKNVHYECKQKTTSLEILFTYKGKYSNIISKDSQISLKLENNTIISKTIIADVVPEDLKINNLNFTNYTLKINLSKEDIERLASSPVTFIRYPNPEGGSLDLEIKGLAKSNGKHILLGATCVLEHL
jgi:hypothetical protein